VFATSQTLLENCRSVRGSKGLVWLPNATGFRARHFLQVPQTPFSECPEIGYLGTLARWIDWAAVVDAARHFRECRFTFLGPLDIKMAQLPRADNISYAGSLAFTELPAYLEKWTVGWIPFLDSRLTWCVDPIKLYDYFAFGLPVVAAALPSLERFSRLCYLANDAGMFIPQLQAALDECKDLQADTRRCERLELAAANTWECRAQEAIRHLK
jgi:glycosyltransferase involved in cell wall biosynthesis